MASTQTRLLTLLSDGALHSGTDLGRCLGISRAAVHKHIATLSAKSLQIRRIPGRGYQLASRIRLLDQTRIQSLVAGAPIPVVIEVVDEIASTNRYLNRNPPQPGVAKVCIAEHQRLGRGRRGRAWMASPYRNLLLSVAWTFPNWPEVLTTLSLSAAVAAAHGVERFTPGPVSLKWPNDIMWGNRKLGGLLIELEGEAGGTCVVVLGLGINVEIGPDESAAIDQPWTDLYTITGAVIDRNLLAAACIEELSAMLARFPESGFAHDRVHWGRRDILTGRPVRALTEAGELCGDARGVDEYGRLIVADTHGAVHRLISGEVSVRTVHAAR